VGDAAGAVVGGDTGVLVGDDAGVLFAVGCSALVAMAALVGALAVVGDGTGLDAGAHAAMLTINIANDATTKAL
jgi:hypothetical protein